MPRGGSKSKRPSGAQQRKAKRAGKKAAQTPAGSMHQYLRRLDDGQGSSKDTVPRSPIDEPDSSDVSMHSAEEQTVEMADFEAEEQGLKMEDSDAEESTDSDCSHDPVSEMSEVKEEESQILRDVSFWEIPLPDHFRVEIIKRGSASFQNKDGPFSVAARQGEEPEGEVCQLSEEWFYITLPNGDKVLRSWMVYSLVSKNLYCFCCRLFAASATDTTSKFVSGFQTWWELNPEVHNHEESEEHLCCFEKWKKMAAGLRPHRTIDPETLMERETQKWRDILHRLLGIILFLARQNLPFHDHEEEEPSWNKGNFLELVELLSKYDPVLKEHLMRFNGSTWKLKVSVPYLAPKTQDEFISALANHVKERLVMDIKSAKYFGILFDSIPSPSDHMSEVIRYVKNNNGKVEVKEVFLGFLSLEMKRAADLSSDILKNLESDGLDIMMCHAQGYGTATTMIGIHGGIEAILKGKNKKAIFNGCVDHSLNLCSCHSFSANALSSMFFGTLEGVLSFFADSTRRWAVLTEHTGVSVDRLSTTHRSAYHAAVQPVKEKFDEFVEALEALSDPQEDCDTRGGAGYFLPSVCDFTFLCYLYFWCDVLQEVNLTQQDLQTKGLTLDMMVTKLEALTLFLHEQCSHLVGRAIEQALLKADEYELAVERVRINRRPGKRASDAGLTPQEENQRGMLECIDHLHSELQIRSRAIKDLAATFEAVQVESLISATEEELQVSIAKLTTFYDEVSESELLFEIRCLRRHLRAAEINLEKVKRDWAALDVLRFIVEWDFIDSLPTLSLSLKLFLTISVSVASCERSFSKLKLIKNYLRSCLEQSRFSNLAILSIESELAKGIDFYAVIDKFAAVKARKGKF